ncbi:hypothetical protein MRS60_07795 [Burkholderia pyrrocinia]|uniref:hypothetical protein n=1 Tax=Burkholderia pyrrocinia TaxID=60550 RepID=UPI001FB4EFF4|nr:hypothetical protein [Burkholderia pyrrocinia]UOB56992.1 hypothetical protein MRS60_07795 [Burkholderia pyrrocinia]
MNSLQSFLAPFAQSVRRPIVQAREFNMSIPPRRSAIPHRRLLRLVVLWTALLLLGAFAANMIGIYLAGGVIAWSRWLEEHKLFFLVWRLCLYAATAAGWVWARRRLLQRDPESRQRVQFMERFALPLAALIELSQWLGQ